MNDSRGLIEAYTRLAPTFNEGKQGVNDLLCRDFVLKYAEPWMQSALDVGCGIGGLTLDVSKRIPHVTGIDITQKMIDYANVRATPGVRFICGDIMTYPLAETFDYIYSILVLNHCDREVVLPKLRSLLNPGGVFLAMDWFAPAQDNQVSRLADYYKARFRHKLSFNLLEILLNLNQLWHASDHPAWRDLRKQSERYDITAEQYKGLVQRVLPGGNFEMIDDGSALILYRSPAKSVEADLHPEN